MYRKLGIILAMILMLLTACWDQKELNNRSIWIGSGFDRIGKEDIVLSGQILIPSQHSQSGGGGSSPDKGFIVVTGKGKNVSEAATDLQGRLSREVFPSHRRVVFIGEQFTQEGIADMLDEHTRNPEVRLRTDMFVVKGGTAKELLQSAYPLEKIPALGASKELEHTSGIEQTTLMRFLRAASSDGSSPILPAISIDLNNNEEQNVTKKQGFRINGVAIFDKNKLRLKGFLNQKEAIHVNWITGVQNSTTLTAHVNRNQDRVSLHLSRIGRRIGVENKNGKLVFHVQLTGKGIIHENQSQLDLRNPANVKLVKEALESEAVKEMKETIVKMQTIYHEDIFGFGEVFHRKRPSAWKKVKNNWNSHFTEALFDVKAEFTVTQIGLTGPGLHLREEDTVP